MKLKNPDPCIRHHDWMKPIRRQIKWNALLTKIWTSLLLWLLSVIWGYLVINIKSVLDTGLFHICSFILNGYWYRLLGNLLYLSARDQLVSYKDKIIIIIINNQTMGYKTSQHLVKKRKEHYQVYNSRLTCTLTKHRLTETTHNMITNHHETKGMVTTKAHKKTSNINNKVRKPKQQ